MNSENPITLERLLDELYASIPDKPGCPGGCCKCCGPVAMTKMESRRMGLQGRMYTLSKGAHNDTCEFVDDATGKCRVYNNRPMTCRIFNAPFAGVFKCFETAHNCGQTPKETGDVLEAYFKLIEKEGHIHEFMHATDKTFGAMKQRETRMGWESRFFGVNVPVK